MKTCETCRWWVYQGGAMGDCRRYAPRPIKTTEEEEYTYSPVWPAMERIDWCGEHQPKEPTP